MRVWFILLMQINEDDVMATRKLFRKHKSNHTIHFYSRKNGCHIWCETFLERNYALSLEFDDEVKCYTSQPDSIMVHGRRYTPDFLVVYKSKPAEFVEVKINDIVKRDKNFENTFSLNRTAIMELTRLNLVLKTDVDIRKVNITTLDRLYRFVDVNITNLKHIGEFPRQTSLADLAEYLDSKSLGGIVDAWALVAQKVYSPDDHSDFGYESMLTLNGCGNA